MTDKKFSNGLLPAEEERLHLLIEECGEAIQAATKILRHGYESRHPDDRHGTTNSDSLMRELGDVLHAIDRLLLNRDIDAIDVLHAATRKSIQSGRWMHHQPPWPVRGRAWSWLDGGDRLFDGSN